MKKNTKADYKQAKATRINGNLYDVVIGSSLDTCVPYSYLVKLAAKGYSVTVDNRRYMTEGDEPEYVIPASK